MRFKKLTTTAITPTRGTPGSAGLDLYADRWASVPHGASRMVGTGIAVEIPEGYVGLVTVRSSMGREGVSLANSVGIVDSDYRGELILNLYNHSYVHADGFGVSAGERIGQLVVVPAPTFDLTEVDSLSTTERGEGGFGSTGR